MFWAFGRYPYISEQSKCRRSAFEGFADFQTKGLYSQTPRIHSRSGSEGFSVETDLSSWWRWGARQNFSSHSVFWAQGLCVSVAGGNDGPGWGLSVWCRHSYGRGRKLLSNQMDKLFAILNRKSFSKILESSDNVISVCISCWMIPLRKCIHPWNVNKWTVNRITVFGALCVPLCCTWPWYEARGKPAGGGSTMQKQCLEEVRRDPDPFIIRPLVPDETNSRPFRNLSDSRFYKLEWE